MGEALGVRPYNQGCLALCLRSSVFSRILTRFLRWISRYESLASAKQRLKENPVAYCLPDIEPFLYEGESWFDRLCTTMFERPSNLPARLPWVSLEPQRPEHVGTRKLLSLEAIYLVCAMQGARSKGQGEENEHIVQILQRNLVVAKQKRGRMSDGSYGFVACEQALARVPSWSVAELSTQPGMHIAYEFSGGKLHHGIYIGSNMVVEMRNFKGMRSCIMITYLYDFLKRVRNSTSPLYEFQYANGFDPDVVIRRALWCLGTYDYDIRRSNCESFVSWVMTQSFDSQMSYVPYKSVLACSQGVLF